MLFFYFLDIFSNHFFMDNIHYKRNLIHIHPLETPLFITFRLHNSIPGFVYQEFVNNHKANSHLIEKSEMEYFQKKELLYREQKKHFKNIDDYLHAESEAEKWLAIPEIGQLVHDKILSFDQARYNLICSSVMPNHVHMLFEHYNLPDSLGNEKGKDKDYPVAQTMRYIKGNTAKEANAIIGRTGPFWQKESYDHYIRNDQELKNVINYIINNPVKAGLVDDWSKWPWTYFAS